jgi:hypothetical protein
MRNKGMHLRPCCNIQSAMDLHAITKEFMAVFEEGDELNMGVPLKSITFMQMAISSSS